MKYSSFIGVDVSKNKLDLCVLIDDELIHLVCKNDPKSIMKTIQNLNKNGIDLMASLVCAEYTGMYIYSLILVCLDLKIDLWLENAHQIKLRSGLQRGKNDKIDAERIAMYAFRFQDVAVLQEEKDKIIEELKYLVSERDLLITDKSKLGVQIKDQKGHMPELIYKNKGNRFKKIIKTLDTAIQAIEKQMNKLIRSEEKLKKQYDLATSVIGVGPHVATQTIIATRGFKAFHDPRKFACHAGVAPFAYTSGSSQKSRWKVSKRANKKLKQLFHMAALSAIQSEGEIKDYYLRKVEQGKNKMSVINSIRGKIIHRIFAAIRDNKKYNKNYIHSLDLSIR